MLADFLEQRPRETDGVENVIIVDNLPIVDPSKLDKLKSVLFKKFSMVGEIVNSVFPVDADGNTKGYAFMEYKKSEMAEDAVKLMDKHKLDKNHTFAVNLFTDFQK